LNFIPLHLLDPPTGKLLVIILPAFPKTNTNVP